MYCIYKLTNPKTKLSYIGLTKNFKNRIRKHKLNLTLECSDFTSEILLSNIPTRAEANEMEKVYIHFFNTYKNGYNKTRGGGLNTETTEKTREKLRAAKKDVHKGENNPFYGKKHTHKSRQEQSKSMTGNNNPFYGKRLSDNHKQKVSDSLKGRKISKEHCKKISEAQKGWNHPRFRKRIKSKWMYILSLARVWYETHNHTTKQK